MPATLTRTRLGIRRHRLAIAATTLLACSSRPTPTADLRVTSFSPAEVSSIDAATIQIQFDRPVVTAEQIGTAADPAALRIEPAVAFRAHWSDRQTLVVEPSTPLVRATRYQVFLAGELAARTGSFHFAFVHKPIEIQGLLEQDAAMVPTLPDLQLGFNQAVTATEVAARCRLVWSMADSAAVALVPVDAAAVADRIAVRPSERLQANADYAFMCDAGLRASVGDTGTSDPWSLTLHTTPLLAIDEIAPTEGTTVPADEVAIEISFSNPVDLESVRAAITATPAIAGLNGGWLDWEGKHYRARVDLDPQTDYQLAVAATLKDVWGQTLPSATAVRFRAGDARPRISAEQGVFAVEAESKGYAMWSRNVNHYTMTCATIPKSSIVGLLAGASGYDPFYARSNDPIAWTKRGLRAKTTTLQLGADKNKWHLQYLDFGGSCGGRAAGAPGLYLAQIHADEVAKDVNAWTDPSQARLLANVTDLGVLLKAGTASGLVWVASLSSGKPVAGATVTLYAPRTGKQVFQGQTDASGLLHTPGAAKLLAQPKAKPAVRGARDEGDGDGGGGWEEEEWGYTSQRLIAVVEKAGDLAVVDGNWADGIQSWNFGLYQDHSGATTRVRGFIQSDRGIYRPGEQVSFKGLVREIAIGQAPRVPQGAKATIHVEDSRGAAILDKVLPISGFGGFHFEVELGAEAPTGDYYVTAKVKDQTFRERFQVEEFRPASFEVSLRGPERDLRIGESMDLAVDAHYLFGAAVAKAKVGWTIERRDHSVSFADYQDFDFVDWAARGSAYFWSWGNDSYPSFVSDGEGTTDDRGLLGFSVRDREGIADLKGPQDYLVTLNVTDQANQTVGKSTVVTAHVSDFYVGLKTKEYVQRVGKPFTVDTVALSPQGKRVATKATLSLVRDRWVCDYDSRGWRDYQTCKNVSETVSSQDIQIPASGAGSETITAKAPGDYVVRVEAKDGSGKLVTTSSYAWVTGKGEASWAGDDEAAMSLVGSKRSYLPGDTAHLVPRTNLAHPTALVSIERNGVIDAWVTELDSTADGIDVAIKDAYAPNVFASVTLVTGRTGKGDRNRPRLKTGLIALPVTAEAKRLTVDVTTDKATYEPGEKVTGMLRVTSDGKPVAAEVSLSVADEGILQLIGYQTPDPMAAFYASWGLGVDAATMWTRIARLSDPSGNDPDAGGDSPAARELKVRSRFLASAYWAPALLTDARGERSFEFTAPDNLTAFRLMAVAADDGARFGKGDRRITVNKKLMAQPVLPRFFRAGDVGQVGVIVHNHTGADGDAVVTVKATGATIATATQRVRVGDGKSVRVDFAATIADAASATFELAVALGSADDAARVTLPIDRVRRVETRTLASGKLGDGVDSAEVDLRWDAKVLAAESTLAVSVDRTGLGELEPSLRYLVEYPYGCLEQTLSKLIPMLKVRDLGKTLGLAGLDGAQLEDFIRIGVAKIQRQQHGDGNFSLWLDSKPEPFLTVYALYGLSEAKRAGVAVDQHVLDAGLSALHDWSNAAERKLGPGGESATVAMAAYVMARLGKPDPGLAARLYEARNGLAPYGQAFLMRALKLGKGDQKQIRALRDALVGAIEYQDGGAGIIRDASPDHEFYMSSDVRATAIALSALVERDAEDAAIDALLEGVRSKRGKNGSWGNTQENFYGLVALADYARSRAAGQTTIAISIGGKEVVKKTVKGGEVVSFRKELAGLAPGKVAVTVSGPARYAIRVTEAREDLERQAVDAGLAVTRTYLDANGVPIRGAIPAGSQVTVKLTVRVPDGARYLALVDPLPAGFEIVNEKLITAARRPGHEDDGDDYDYEDYESYVWSHSDLRDDEVQAFSDQPWSNDLELTYQARATLAGTFAAPAAHAELMYEPWVHGRSTTETIVIAK